MMGKRSSFARRERDFYPTPESAVLPLLPHLPDDLAYWEPCAGDGALIRSLSGRAKCVAATDISPIRNTEFLDAFAICAEDMSNVGADAIITNPPWSRDILHPMIAHFSAMRPTWLLFDADWMHTRQAVPYLPWLRKIVSVGRVKWIPDSPHTGKDNCCWHLFDQSADSRTEFHGRTA